MVMMVAAAAVDDVKHRGQGGGFAAAGRPGHQSHPAPALRDFLNRPFRQVQLIGIRDLLLDVPHDDRHVPALFQTVDAEAAGPVHVKPDVRVAAAEEPILLLGCHHLVKVAHEVFRRQRRLAREAHLPVHTQYGRTEGLEMNVRRAPFHRVGQHAPQRQQPGSAPGVHRGRFADGAASFQQRNAAYHKPPVPYSPDFH